MKYISKSLEETDKVSQIFWQKIKSLKKDQALVVALYGDLGSGKTTFTQALARNIGISDIITSPTFVIRKSYKVHKVIKLSSDKDDLNSKNLSTFNFQPSTLIHIDAYRLDSAEELLSLNLAEDIADPHNLILLEWPERVKKALPKEIIKINFTFINETEREIEFE